MIYPLDEVKTVVTKLIQSALDDFKYGCEVKLEIPPDDHMGDFAFPCFSLAPIAKKGPNVIAQEIKEKISKDDWLERVEVKGAYVNFYLDKDRLIAEVMKSIFADKNGYGFLESKKKKVIVEHTSANPNGPLHVGRARNPILGDTMVRLFRASGYDVESQFYLDDMGKQVGILSWGVNNLKKEEIPKSDNSKPDHRAVGFYQKASSLLKEDPKVERELGEIVKKLEEGDPKTIEVVHKAYAPVLKGMKESMKTLNIEFDRFVPESDFVKDKSVDKVVEGLKKSEFCDIEDGAYFLDFESFGIKGRSTKFFFLRKDGTSLYATRDIAYHLWKAKNADMLVNVLGEDHKLESKQVEIALGILDSKVVPDVVFYSFVSLPGGKMSTRRGRVVYIDDLIDECISRAFDEVKKRRGSELSEKQMKDISRVIGVGALRYNIIKVQPEKDIVFKWEDALSFDGNAAPFIQYSHARACSILRKKEDGFEGFDSSKLYHDSEKILIKKLGGLPVVVDEACHGFKPHIVTGFLFEVASCFNQFYRDCPVLSEDDVDVRKARLALVDATRVVLKNGLDLLGIVAPEEM